jgi:hypothetical protein
MNPAIATPILAHVPEHLLQQVQMGAAERVGMIVRDTATKKIIGHLQETGLTQTIVGKVLGTTGGLVANPVSAVTSIGTLIQNEQIKGKLDVMETVMGGMQALQMATLVTSVAGIGVTAASTAMILNRLTKIDRSLQRIEEKFDETLVRREDWDLHHILKKVEGQLQRLDEARVIRDPDPEVRSSDRALHEAFGALEIGIRYVGRRETIDSEFLTQLLSALSLCGSAQIKALIWLDEKDRAAERARALFNGYQAIARSLPQDLLLQRFAGADAAASDVTGFLSEVRHRIASVPSLAATLTSRSIHGRDYLEHAESEDEAPLLLLTA